MEKVFWGFVAFNLAQGELQLDNSHYFIVKECSGFQQQTTILLAAVTPARGRRLNSSAEVSLRGNTACDPWIRVVENRGLYYQAGSTYPGCLFDLWLHLA